MPLLTPAILALLLATSPLYAAAYHVSSKGNNNASGTSLAMAWRTIEHAANRVQAGDQILVHSGTYKGDIRIPRGGAEGAPIRFEALSNKAVIEGAFVIEGKAWIEIVGFTLKGPKRFPTNWQDMPALVVDDLAVGLIDPRENRSTRREKVVQKFKTYTELKKHMEDYYHSGVLIRGKSSHITVKGNTISHYTQGIFLTDQASFILLENNSIHHCRIGIWSFDNDGISATDVVVRANSSTQNLVAGIEFRNGAQRVIIEDNFCQYNGISHIAFRRGSAHAIIRNNRVQYGGYYAETMANPGSSALNLHSLDPGANILVEGNFAAYQQEPTWDSNGLIIDISPSVDAVIRRNVFYRNMGAGVAFTKSSVICIYNNTFVENGYMASGILSPLNGPGLSFVRDTEKDNRIVNNIFYKNRIAGLYSGGQLHKQARVDHNLYMTANQAAIIRDSRDLERAFTSLKEVQTYTAAEDNGIERAPLFKDPTNLDFTLQLISPALDKGGFLTHTLGSGNGTRVPVEDARYFYAGFGDIPGDQIVVGVQPPVHITKIDKANNCLVVDRAITWTNGIPVSLPFAGNAPDIGAFEFFSND